MYNRLIFIDTYIILERIINLTPVPSGLYASLKTKIIGRNTRKRKRAQR